MKFIVGTNRANERRRYKLKNDAANQISCCIEGTDHGQDKRMTGTILKQIDVDSEAERS